MKYHFSIRRAGNGFWASCIELKGCATQASSRKQLDRNMKEALNLFLEEPPDSKLSFPFPKRRVKGTGIVAVPVEPRVALAFVLRTARLKRKLTQTQAAQLIGMKGLYSYQRLEAGRTANPEFKTLILIKNAFPELDLDDLLAA